MPWHEILAAGVDDWSEYSDTDDERAADGDGGGGGGGERLGKPLKTTLGADPDGIPTARKPTAETPGTTAPKDRNVKTVVDVDGSAEDGNREGTTRGAEDGSNDDDGRETPTVAQQRPPTNGNGTEEEMDAKTLAGRRTHWQTKLGLDGSWRSERRELEWQCLWVELRMREIERHVERYETRLREMEDGDGVDAGSGRPEAVEGEDEGGGSSARVNDGKNGALERKRRDGAGDAVRPPVILGHPLFAPLSEGSGKERSGSKKKTSSGGADPSVTTTAHLNGGKGSGAGKRAGTFNNPKGTASEKKQKVMERIAPRETNSDSDLSTTALYEQIEAAQKRIASLQQRLSAPAPKLMAAQKNDKSAKTPMTKGNKGAEKTPGSSAKRRGARTVDAFDIDNVVSAQGPAKYVERPIHETIATPKVRVSKMFSETPVQVVTDGDSSEEDISDEVYIMRHAKLEVDERAARAPLVRGRSAKKSSGPSGKQMSLITEVDAI